MEKRRGKDFWGGGGGVEEGTFILDMPTQSIKIGFSTPVAEMIIGI